MRFHMGVSFNWRTIKKFLIPILIGFATYFGLNFLNGESVPLGFIKTYALEEDSTVYNIDYTEDTSVILDSEFESESEFEPESESISEEVTEHKSLFYKIFWFDDNSTVLGVLTSIYELLLLYCVGMLLLRFITIIKNTRW